MQCSYVSRSSRHLLGATERLLVRINKCTSLNKHSQGGTLDRKQERMYSYLGPYIIVGSTSLN